MLPCIYSVIDHRWSQNVVRTKRGAHKPQPGVSYHSFMSSVICYGTDPWKQNICLIILWCHGIIQHIIHMLVVFLQSCIVVVWVLQLQLVVQFYKIALLVYVTVNNYKLYFCLITACSNFSEDTKESCNVRIFSWAWCFWNKRSIHAGRITDWLWSCFL